MRNYKAPVRVCDCGTKWVAASGGQGRRNQDHCHDCYPLFRQAYKLWYAALTRSKKQAIAFTLTVNWVFERLKQPCPKTGMPFVIGAGGQDFSDRNPYSASIDKICPNEGYTPENCQVVSWLYNCAKQRFSEEDVYDFCLKVVSFKTINHATTVAQATD